jgi:hypothetical protein
MMIDHPKIRIAYIKRGGYLLLASFLFAHQLSCARSRWSPLSTPVPRPWRPYYKTQLSVVHCVPRID